MVSAPPPKLDQAWDSRDLVRTVPFWIQLLQADLPLRQVAFAVILYAACSSTLLLINKATLYESVNVFHDGSTTCAASCGQVAMSFVPDASFILFCQFLSSSVTAAWLALIRSCQRCGDFNLGSLEVRLIRCAAPDADIELIRCSARLRM